MAELRNQLDCSSLNQTTTVVKKPCRLQQYREKKTVRMPDLTYLDCWSREYQSIEDLSYDIRMQIDVLQLQFQIQSMNSKYHISTDLTLHVR